MLVYLSVMLLCCILLYAMRNDSNKKRPLAIAFGLIWLMIALQDGWGGDRDAYIMIYDRISGMSFSELLTDDSHGEIGFKLFMSIMPSAHIGQVIGIGIWCIAMAFFFYHFVPQRWWFFAILFVFLDKSILMGMVSSYARMAIANAFLIFAVYNTLNNKRILAIALIVLGSFFHTSVLFMLPLVFVGKGYNRASMTFMIGVFVLIAIISMLFPSTWVSFVENIIMGVDALESYSFYFEEQASFGTKGLVLIILFFWIYLLSHTTSQKGYDRYEYLVMYYALIRIAFDLLPAFGLSTRFFYYIDIYFFAGMMCVLNRLPQKDIVNKAAIMATLLLIFWFTGFRVYSTSEHFLMNWATYNPIF